MNQSCVTSGFKLREVLGWGSVRSHSRRCQIAKVLTQVLGCSVQEQHEAGEESLSLGVSAGNNSACREVKGVEWVWRRLRSDF